MLYPLLFQAHLQSYLWGGERLKSLYGIKDFAEPVAESWLLSAHPGKESTVINGALAGKNLSELTKLYGKALIGNTYREGATFPLLLKLIDAKDNLSIQVHPDDELAKKYNYGENGKCEAWYVLDTPPEAERRKIICGLKEGVEGVTFEKAIREHKCEKLLRYVNAEKGTVINVPAGLVHAVTSGYFVYEVQQTCDVTFRIYDYERTGADGKLRDLHIDEALICTRYDWSDATLLPSGLELPPMANSALLSGTFKRNQKIFNRYFTLEKWDLQGELAFESLEAFAAITVTDGSLSINYLADEKRLNVLVTPGQTVLLPACLQNFSLQAQAAACLVSSVPTATGRQELMSTCTHYGTEKIADAVALEPKFAEV